jgi:hypothetical protein
LTVPALLWIAAFMLADRLRHKRQPLGPGEPLRQSVESSLTQVEHQIWLVRNVFWWALLPTALAVLPFFGEVSWSVRLDGWWIALLALAVPVSIVAVMFVGIYSLNQTAVRCGLEPRRQELEALLSSLKDETPGMS